MEKPFFLYFASYALLELEFWISALTVDFYIVVLCLFAFVRPIYVAAKSVEDSTHSEISVNLAKRAIMVCFLFFCLFRHFFVRQIIELGEFD